MTDERARSLRSVAGDAVSRPCLTAEGVVKHWARQPEPVLAGVDMVLAPGTVNALTGRNGAGKTTLLRILAGLILPDSGRVRLEGLDPRKHRRAYQRRLGFLSAGDRGLYARLSGRDHLRLCAALAMLPRAARRQALETAIERFELEPFVARRVDRISTGQRQRLRLALAFLHDPALVLLDEPWNSLDEHGAERLRAVLAEFAGRGGTAVCCAPTAAELGGLAASTYVVGGGRLERV